MENRVKMVNSRGALESLRHIGITLEEGITELVDNSIDAGSQTIVICFHELEDGQVRMIIADDGVGIPESFSDSSVTQTVQHVLRFGGKIPHKGRAIPIGKYGFGLSQTAAGLSSVTTVSSKVNNGTWRTCVYDLVRLRKEKAFLPAETTDSPDVTALPEILQSVDSGTVIDMQLKNDLGIGSLKSLKKRLEKKLGRIYRNALNSGLEMMIFLNGESDGSIVLRDPLAQLANSYEVLKYGKQGLVVDEIIRFDGRDIKPFGQIIDPQTGTFAEIRVRMVMYDINQVESVLDEKLQNKGQKINKLATSRAGFNKNEQGFSVVRSGREIKHGETLGLFTKHDQQNFFRGEIEFNSQLDTLFNVQVVKGRYLIDKRLKDILHGRYKKTIQQIRVKTQQIRNSRRLHSSASQLPKAEARTKGMRRNLNRRVISPELRERKLNELEGRKNSVIAAVEKKEDDKIAKVKTEVKAAAEAGDKKKQKVLEEKLLVTEATAKRVKTAVRRRFENDSFMRKEVKALPSGDLYAVDDYDDEIWVTINSESDFFQSMYARASQHADEGDLLDLMIFAIAYAEADKSNSEAMDAFWKDTRQLISRLSHLFVSLVDHIDPVEPVPVEDDKEEEAEIEPESHVQLSLTEAFGG